MKTRHLAAALALMGWYLLVPPTTRIWWVGPERTDNAAQLSQWTIQQSFDKAGVCESARMAAQQQVGDAAIRMGDALCVATDDPRLNSRI
jgi:hypothetical protein